ncbi:unnamed protein product [Gadus morhua 'NCC']
MSLHRDKPKVDPVEQPQAAAALEPLEDGHEANVREDSLSTPDSRSQLSKRSNGSAISSAAARARAKSKAAQAQVTFAEREASVMRQKAELEASLHVLRSQKMAAAAAAAYEEEEIESGEKRYEPYVLGKPSTAYERAGDYVQQHSAMFGGEQSPPLHAQLDAYRPPPSTPAPLDFHRLPQRYAEAVVHTKPKPRVSNIKKEQPPPPLSSPNLGPSPEPQPAQDLARPFWVVVPTEADRETCQCKTHENLQFMANTLYSQGLSATKNLEEMRAMLLFEGQVCNLERGSDSIPQSLDAESGMLRLVWGLASPLEPRVQLHQQNLV